MSEDFSDIDKLFRECYKELCIISHYYLCDFNEAEDVVQGVFLKYIQLSNKTNILSPKGYLKVVVRNESLKRVKTIRAKQPINQNHLIYNPTNSEEEESLALQKKQALYKEIELLPIQCRRIFLLCVSEGLKYQEVADKLNISINTVKTQMKKAFKVLRASLKDLYLFLFFRR